MNLKQKHDGWLRWKGLILPERMQLQAQNLRLPGPWPPVSQAGSEPGPALQESQASPRPPTMGQIPQRGLLQLQPGRRGGRTGSTAPACASGSDSSRLRPFLRRPTDLSAHRVKIGSLDTRPPVAVGVPARETPRLPCSGTSEGQAAQGCNSTRPILNSAPAGDLAVWAGLQARQVTAHHSGTTRAAQVMARMPHSVIESESVTHKMTAKVCKYVLTRGLCPEYANNSCNSTVT